MPVTVGAELVRMKGLADTDGGCARAGYRCT
jgi:hypothetical protein